MSMTDQKAGARLRHPLSVPRGETVALHPHPEEAASYDALSQHLSEALDGEGAGHLVSIDGSTVEVPASLMAALRRAVVGVTRGRAVTMAPADLEMTSQQAADLLHVSRPHLNKLLDQGDIDSHRTSSHPAAHRRVLLQDLLDYRDRRNIVRRKALDELTAVAMDADGDYY